MGWFAVGSCSLIAAFAFYKFVHQSSRKESRRLENVDPLSEVSQDLKSIPAHQAGVKTSAQGIDQNETTLTTAPTFSIDDLTVQHDEQRLPRLPISISMDKDMSSSGQSSAVAVPAIISPPSPLPRSSSPPRLKPPSFGAMPPPPRPGNGSLRTPPSAAASLRVPTTKVLSNTSMAPSSLLPRQQQPASRQVELKPGYSPLDWAALTSRPNSQLKGKDAPENLIRVTPTQLKLQNGRKGRDAWTVFQGKVYNITAYLPFHPGGVGELMRGAGKSADKLFMETHPWVNWDGMLSACLVGILISEEEAKARENSGGLDEMD